MTKEQYSTELIRHKRSEYFFKVSADFLICCNGNQVAAAILEIICSRQEGGLFTASYLRSAMAYTASEKTILRAIEYLKRANLITSSGARNQPKYLPNIPVIQNLLDKIEQCSEYFHDGIRGLDIPSLSDKMSGRNSTNTELVSGQNVRNDRGCSGQNVLMGGSSSGQNVRMNEFVPDKMSDNKDINSIYNTVDIYTTNAGFSIKGEKEKSEKEDEGLVMGTENTRAVIQAYRRGGSKFKAKAFQKSAANLLARYGEKIEKLIQDHGEDAVIAGVENFLQDEYWIKNGLPLTAFLKSAHRWIPEPDGSPNDTFYRPSKFKKPSTARTPPSRIAPGAPNEQKEGYGTREEISISAPEPDRERLRAMRRNEGLVIIRASGSPSAGDFIREVGMEEFGKMTDVEVDCWFDRVCEEFKSLKKVSAPISSRRISE